MRQRLFMNTVLGIVDITVIKRTVFTKEQNLTIEEQAALGTTLYKSCSLSVIQSPGNVIQKYSAKYTFLFIQYILQNGEQKTMRRSIVNGLLARHLKYTP